MLAIALAGGATAAPQVEIFKRAKVMHETKGTFTVAMTPE